MYPAKNTLEKSLIEKKLIEKYCYTFDITKILFLNIDPYQYIIGKWSFSRFKNLKISGICLNLAFDSVKFNPKDDNDDPGKDILGLRNLINFIFNSAKYG